MTLIKHSDIIKAIKTLLIESIDDEEYPIKRVFYGDTDLTADYPAISVMSVRKARRMGPTGRFTVNYQTEVLIEYGAVQSREVTREYIDDIAEKTDAILNQSRSLSGLVIDSFVESVEFGAVNRKGVMVQACRLRHIALTQEAQ